MGSPFILTVLSEDGYQVFAALYREYDTLERAIEGAKVDYLKRYGGNPAFRVYHAEGDGDASGYRHTLIEVCFDETKRRSFVALYKVLQEVEPAPTRSGRFRFAVETCARILRRLIDDLRNLFHGPGASGVVLAAR
jgi:selenocysteine lyase/cysteine desulfurase